MTPETTIKGHIKQYLRIKGWLVMHMLQGLGSYAGLSDLVAIKRGRVVWIEVKTPKGILSDRQKKFRKEITEAGGEYIISRSLDDIMAWEKEQHERSKALSLAEEVGIGSTSVEAGR